MCLVISRLALTLYKFWATWENGPYGKFEQRRPGSDCAFAQSDPGLLCSSNYVKVFRNSVSVQRRPWSICAKWRLVRVCVACKGHFLLLCMKFVGCLLQEILTPYMIFWAAAWERAITLCANSEYLNQIAQPWILIGAFDQTHGIL